MSKKGISLHDLSLKINANLAKGDKDFLISSIGSSNKNSLHSIVYIRNKKYLNSLKESESSTCLVSSDLLSKASGYKNILVSDNPHYSFALLTNLFVHKSIDATLQRKSELSNQPLIGHGSQISEKVKFGKNVSIGCNCVIEDGVLIGDNSIIENNVVIYRNSKIGNNAFISSGVIIGSEGFGFAKQGSKWVQISHLGKVVIGNYVSIGANSCIDRGTIEDTVISYCAQCIYWGKNSNCRKSRYCWLKHYRRRLSNRRDDRNLWSSKNYR